MPANAIVTGHYAGTYYPLYNFGPNEWIVPSASIPFDKVGVVFAAFAHVYPRGKGAVLAFEARKPYESARLKRLETVARTKNPRLKVLITLGWGKKDWNFIALDYATQTNVFVPSVIAFLRKNALDGFDIDDEGIGRTDTGIITQAAFDGVVAALRSALDRASKTDKRPYYLVITPAGDNPEPGGIDGTQIDANNASSFDWINLQTYWRASWSSGMVRSLKKIGYPAKSIAVGVNTEGCKPSFPPYNGLKGIFNWTMSADSACKFKYTRQIAKDVGY